MNPGDTALHCLADPAYGLHAMRVQCPSQMSRLGLGHRSADLSFAIEARKGRLCGLDDRRRIHEAVHLDSEFRMKALFGDLVQKQPARRGGRVVHDPFSDLRLLRRRRSNRRSGHLGRPEDAAIPLGVTGVTQRRHQDGRRRSIVGSLRRGHRGQSRVGHDVRRTEAGRRSRLDVQVLCGEQRRWTAHWWRRGRGNSACPGVGRSRAQDWAKVDMRRCAGAKSGGRCVTLSLSSGRGDEEDDSGPNQGDQEGSDRQDDAQPHVANPLVTPSLWNQNLGRRRRLLCHFNRHDATITSTMLRVKVDRAEEMTLHDQVAAEIRRAIADGEALPGDRLPPAKDLAAVLEVNTNTVLRALRLLRDEGLLEFRRGRGVTVAGTPERGTVLKHARELIELARLYGYRREDVIEMIAGLR